MSYMIAARSQPPVIFWISKPFRYRQFRGRLLYLRQQRTVKQEGKCYYVHTFTGHVRLCTNVSNKNNSKLYCIYCNSNWSEGLLHALVNRTANTKVSSISSARKGLTEQVTRFILHHTKFVLLSTKHNLHILKGKYYSMQSMYYIKANNFIVLQHVQKTACWWINNTFYLEACFTFTHLHRSPRERRWVWGNSKSRF